MKSSNTVRRLLLVDDDPITTFAIKKIMTLGGNIVDTATNGDEAIESIKKSDYDVILIDYSMPVKDGIETINEIRNVLRNETPIVLMLNYEFEAAENPIKEADNLAIMEKPLTKDELNKVFDRLGILRSLRIENDKVKNLVLDITIPDEMDDEQVKEFLTKLVLTADEEHRLLGGKGLQIGRVKLSEKVNQEVAL